MEKNWLEGVRQRVDFGGRTLERTRSYRIAKPRQNVYYRSFLEGDWADLILNLYEEDGGATYIAAKPGLLDLDDRFAAAFLPHRLVPLVNAEGDVVVWRWRHHFDKDTPYTLGNEMAVERMLSDWVTLEWRGGAYISRTADDMSLSPMWPEEIGDVQVVLTKCVGETGIIHAPDHGIFNKLRGVTG